MGTILTIIIIVVMTAGLGMIFSSRNKVVLGVISKATGDRYVAKLSERSKGDTVEDWNYYYGNGAYIEDTDLKTLLFNTFVNEDWYGDYEYHVDDEAYYNKILKVDEIRDEINLIEDKDKPNEVSPITKK